MKIDYGTETIEFSVEYRDRKTIEIGVEAPDTVTVIAPIGLDDEILLKHMQKKCKWIIQKQFQLKEIQAQKLNREYVNGEAFLYLGRNYTLNIVDNQLIKKPETKLYQGKFIINTPVRDQKKLKASMEDWYREKTFEKVLERIAYHQKYFEVEPITIKVKEQKKRWASCTSKRELFFNWRCTMAPTWVLDYIVLHEMCHMLYMDHSKEFWSLLGQIMPDYEKRREWLKNYGVKMDL